MVDKVTKKINLDLTGVANKAEVKREIGEFVVGEILRYVSKASSPVSGGQYKKTLSKEYADEQKGGNRTANLELEGDMLDSLISKNTKDGIEVGIFKSSEVGKADGHNNFSGDSKLPTRQFIPKEDQKFKRSIESGIKQIINEAKGERPTAEETFTNIFVEEDRGIGVGDLFGDDFLTDFLRQEGFIDG